MIWIARILLAWPIVWLLISAIDNTFIRNKTYQKLSMQHVFLIGLICWICGLLFRVTYAN